jgi:hypothetical protein
MATGNATKPTAGTEKTRKDRQLKYRIAIPFTLRNGTTIEVCQKTSADNTLFSKVGVTEITETYDAVARKAVVYANNIQVPTAIRIKADGDNESVAVSVTKTNEIKKNKEEWKFTKGKQTSPSLTTKATTLYYATVGELKIGKYGNTRPDYKADTEKFMAEAGMKKATVRDLKEIIMDCAFPRLPVATASNGKNYPVDPSKIDSLPEGWRIQDLGAYTKEDFFSNVENW